jgi:hypothetical protein
MKFTNMNKATAGVVTVNMGAGKIELDSTCTTGTIKIRGTGEVIDQSNGTIVDNDVTYELVKTLTGLATEATLLRGLGLLMENHVEDDIIRDVDYILQRVELLHMTKQLIYLQHILFQ